MFVRKRERKRERVVSVNMRKGKGERASDEERKNRSIGCVCLYCKRCVKRKRRERARERDMDLVPKNVCAVQVQVDPYMQKFVCMSMTYTIHARILVYIESVTICTNYLVGQTHSFDMIYKQINLKKCVHTRTNKRRKNMHIY